MKALRKLISVFKIRSYVDIYLISLHLLNKMYVSIINFQKILCSNNSFSEKETDGTLYN